MSDFIVLDMMHGASKNLEYNKGETGRTLQIKITNGDYKKIDLTDYDVKCSYIRPDGVQGMVDLTKLDAVNGLAELEVSDEMLQVQGNLALQVSLWQGANDRYFKSFVIKVNKTLIEEDDIYNSADYISLVNAFAKVTGFDSRISALESGGGSGSGGSGVTFCTATDDEINAWVDAIQA